MDIPHEHSGFSLMEMLLVLGIIGILATFVISAINPTKQLRDARNTDRNISVREIENAINQYLIDGNTLSGIPANIGNALPICQSDVAPGTCTEAGGYNLSALSANGKYLVSLPIDPDEEGFVLTGYRIYQLNTFVKVCSPLIDYSCG